MPSSNSKRQSQETRLWKYSPKMYRRSKLQLRGSLGRGDSGGDSLSSRGLRSRSVITRDRAGNFDGREDDDDVEGRNFRTFDQALVDDEISDSSDESGDDIGGFSDDDSDDDEVVNTPQQQIQPPPPPPPPPPPSPPSLAKSSGSIVTLTALQPPRTTAGSGITTTPLPVLPTPTKPILAVQTLTETDDFKYPVPTSDRKEAGDPNTLPSSTFTTKFLSTSTTIPAAIATASTTIGQTPQPVLDNGDDSSDGDKHRMHDKNPPPRGLDPVAEHLLIAAGAIGAFILFCFIGWIIYRVMKKTKGQGIGVSGGMGFIDKFPWKRRGPMDGAWDGRAMYMTNEAPPNYEKGEYGGAMQSGVYGPGKPYPPGPGSAARSVMSNSEMGTLRQMPNNDSALASILDQYPADNEGAANNNVNLTLRSQSTQPYYTASELVRQQPDTYTPQRRAGNRASELSSISSGFGDGDIIIPPPLAASKSSADEDVDDSTREIARDSARDSRRESWMDREEGRRETVYTTTSEDRPARFRSITSWVNQQAGRAKRAGSRARERGEVPVMPAIPGEISAIRQTAYR
ncbi:uncharacterized protein GGS22DRAFT_51607 [Annulohypoxylon maeteangense]|uniref:uncharacterized protein n=1 Tax=Annulohypoxylon maeteangense TaxID=1927788 RepID=UPI0020088FB4|nr:uncharacterized protein GGS22DRAFT_51607 [Annulohypoxylon maeteangense]KAI0881867.1 hypothetical protein GGS22DRAFT_51607 [Annulohypoxylon maeteangense]